MAGDFVADSGIGDIRNHPQYAAAQRADGYSELKSGPREGQAAFPRSSTKPSEPGPYPQAVPCTGQGIELAVKFLSAGRTASLHRLTQRRRDAARAKILLVEDNEMNRDMLSRRLLKRGFTVAADGMEGVASAIEQQPTPWRETGRKPSRLAATTLTPSQ